MPKALSMEQKLARIAQFRDKRDAEGVAFLRKALADRYTYVIARAAAAAGESGDDGFVADLIKAFDKLTEDPLKSDKGCIGKTAIVEALLKLGCRDAAFYRRGLKYEQVEPAYGTPRRCDDTAARIRGICAMGLVECEKLLEALILFAELLADEWKAARMGAAQALGQLACQEGIAVLRHKLLCGDEEPEVIGDCCSALLQLDFQRTLPYVVEQLDSPSSDVCVEAALALGESRHALAFAPLKECWETRQGSACSAPLLASIALLRRKEATQFLVSLISDHDAAHAEDALRALAPYRFSKELYEQVQTAVAAAGSRKLQQMFETRFHVS